MRAGEGGQRGRQSKADRRGEYKRNKRVQILIMLKTGGAVEQGSNGESVGNWEKESDKHFKTGMMMY